MKNDMKNDGLSLAAAVCREPSCLREPSLLPTKHTTSTNSIASTAEVGVPTEAAHPRKSSDLLCIQPKVALCNGTEAAMACFCSLPGLTAVQRPGFLLASPTAVLGIRDTSEAEAE